MTLRGIRIFKNRFLVDGSVYLATFVAVWGLKQHYSVADSRDLSWILKPTATLVELISGTAFQAEPGSGFVNTDRRIVIAPACAGVNFLIIAVSMTVFSFTRRFSTRTGKILWLPACFLGGYALTLAVNTCRILLSMHSYDGGWDWGWLGPERIHRMEGILIYFVFLVLVYGVMDRVFNSQGSKTNTDRRLPGWFPRKKVPALLVPRSGFIPFFWYGAVVVVVPLLNNTYAKTGNRFLEHCAWVLVLCLLVILILHLVKILYRKGSRNFT
jgi:exosortase K